MSVRQVATGLEGTAFEVRQDFVCVWVDGVQIILEQNATMADCRARADEIHIEKLAAVMPPQLDRERVPKLTWVTYP